MTAGADDVGGRSAHALLALLVQVTHGMREISGVLRKNPQVTEVTRESDVGHQRDFMSDEAQWVFETYVEAQTKTGDAYTWSLSLLSMRQTWTIWRVVSKVDGEGPDIDFDDVTFATFAELEAGMPEIVAEFVESARRFTV